MIKEEYPPGHFYSVLPDIENEHLNWEPKYLGLDYNDESHINILNEIEQYLTKFDETFGIEDDVEELKLQHKYSLNNNAFTSLDARILHYYLQKNKPKKYIEIGSGMSTLLVLNTKEMFNLDLEIICIEPHPSPHLLSLHKQGKINLIIKKIQDIGLSIFKSLDENDILFIDSSHVVKINSDVLYVFKNVLPILKSDVRVHFHDIFLPYDYPPKWLHMGRFWNEQYFLFVFLQFNQKFKIEFGSMYARFKCRKMLTKLQINTYEQKELSGGSIWLNVNKVESKNSNLI
jgi:predicted O-methyltransferase YrrM